MSKKLFLQAIIKFVFGVLLVGLLVFIPAGTLRFFNGWLFMGVLFIPMFVAGLVMMVKNPKLLESRLNAKEKQMDQSLVVKLSGLMFLAMPLILGSLISFVIFLAYPFLIAKRIKGEEAFLEQELQGYSEYKEKVKYRLIPFIW